MPVLMSAGPDETMAIGRRLAQQIKGGQVVAFRGALGAGKTTFCRGMAQGLGCQDAVSSPTFTIANLYRGPVPFAHFDAYRIKDEADLETAGFYDYLDGGAVVAVEWSERVAAYIPDDAVWVTIEVLDETARRITIEGAVLA